MPRSRRPPTSPSSHSSAADDYAFSSPGTASSSSSPYFTTENPQPLPIALHAHYAAQYQYPDDPDALDGVIEEEEEEEEESDAEDVFAYLPPSTADQQRDQRQPPPQPPPQPRVPPPVDSPPETGSSFDALSQGPDALRLRQLSANSQNDASSPFRGPLEPNTSPTSAKQLRVALPSPAPTAPPGPSQPQSQSYFPATILPGNAYDNPYQFTLSQMSANSIPPSTPTSTLAGSDGLRHRHNITVGIIKRSKRRRGKIVEHRSTDFDDPDKDTSTTVEGSIAKLVGSEISSLDYTGGSRRAGDRALDELDDGTWSRREGSIKSAHLVFFSRFF